MYHNQRQSCIYLCLAWLSVHTIVFRIKIKQNKRISTSTLLRWVVVKSQFMVSLTCKYIMWCVYIYFFFCSALVPKTEVMSFFKKYYMTRIIISRPRYKYNTIYTLLTASRQEWQQKVQILRTNYLNNTNSWRFILLEKYIYL